MSTAFNDAEWRREVLAAFEREEAVEDLVLARLAAGDTERRTYEALLPVLHDLREQNRDEDEERLMNVLDWLWRDMS